MPRIGTLALFLALGCASSEPAEAPSTTTSGNEELPAAPTLTGPEARALVADGAFLLDVTRADRAWSLGAIAVAALAAAGLRRRGRAR